MRRALISGITSGTAGSHAEGGGIVHHHAAGLHRDGRILLGDAAAGREQRDVDAVEGCLPSIPRSSAPGRGKLCFLPAERAEASSFSDASGTPRLSMQPTNSRPTAPVAPTMATVLFFTSSPFLCGSGSRQRRGNKKAPSGLERGLGLALALLQARAIPAPPGLVGGLGLALGASSSWARNLWARSGLRQRLQPRDMAHFAARAGFRLAIKMQRARLRPALPRHRPRRR